MSRKIYLSTYIVEIEKKGFNKTPLNLSDFAKGENIHQLMKDFALDLAKSPFYTSEYQKIGKKIQVIKKSLKMSDPLILESNTDTGDIFGLMRSGASLGRNIPVDDTDTGKHAYDMKGTHARMFPIYFHLQTFKNRKYALFILERQGEFGIKKLFETAFSDFLVKRNLSDYRLVMSNFLIGRIFDKMLEESRITEVSFIRNIIPDNLATFFDQGHKKTVGKVRETYTAGRGESLPLRGLASKLFKRLRPKVDGRTDHMVRLDGVSDPFDEVDFELLDANGVKKTIHMANTGRSLPDYDVTNNLTFDDTTNEPTLDSLKSEAELLFADMKDYYEGKNKKE